MALEDELRMDAMMNADPGDPLMRAMMITCMVGGILLFGAVLSVLVALATFLFRRSRTTPASRPPTQSTEASSIPLSSVASPSAG